MTIKEWSPYIVRLIQILWVCVTTTHSRLYNHIINQTITPNFFRKRFKSQTKITLYLPPAGQRWQKTVRIFPTLIRSQRQLSSPSIFPFRNDLINQPIPRNTNNVVTAHENCPNWLLKAYASASGQDYFIKRYVIYNRAVSSSHWVSGPLLPLICTIKNSHVEYQSRTERVSSNGGKISKRRHRAGSRRPPGWAWRHHFSCRTRFYLLSQVVCFAVSLGTLLSCVLISPWSFTTVDQSVGGE